MADVHPSNKELEEATIKLMERIVALTVQRNGNMMTFTHDDIKSVSNLGIHLFHRDGFFIVTVSDEQT